MADGRVAGQGEKFRKKFEDAGVLIEIVKWDGIFAMSDDEVDYCFQVSKALGAKALSSEMSLDGAKRVGQFADKHKMQIGHHGHATTTDADFETVFSTAKYNAANLDLGHFIADKDRQFRSFKSTSNASRTCTSRTANSTTARMCPSARATRRSRKSFR